MTGRCLSPASESFRRLPECQASAHGPLGDILDPSAACGLFTCCLGCASYGVLLIHLYVCVTTDTYREHFVTEIQERKWV